MLPCDCWKPPIWPPMFILAAIWFYKRNLDHAATYYRNDGIILNLMLYKAVETTTLWYMAVAPDMTSSLALQSDAYSQAEGHIFYGGFLTRVVTLKIVGRNGLKDPFTHPSLA